MDPQLALRLGALRLARRRGRTREAAWAASRLRLDGMHLEPADLRFARDVRVKLGHALRVARLRGAFSARPEVSIPERPIRLRRRSLWRPLVAAEIASLLVVISLLLFVPTPSVASGEPEGAPAAQAAAIETQPPPLRGRTQPGSVVPVAFVAATPAPNPAPASAAPAGGGTASGSGSGTGGSGGGIGKGTPAPTTTPVPTATPSPAPTPFIDPRNLVHVLGRVVDSRTRAGIANVCISYGTLDCSLASHTDRNGNFDIPLDGRSSWIFRFIQAGYTTASLNNVRLRPGPPINVGTIQLRRGP